MKLFETKRRVERYDNIQILVEFCYIGGMAVAKRELDRETIPDHVLISLGCFGDTGGWTSKFKEYIVG